MVFTQNYATELEFATHRDEQNFLENHLRDLSGAMEHGRADAWSVDEMGARLQKLSSRVVAIEASINSVESRFKLGQDEGDITYSEIVEKLASAGNNELLTWMRAFNPDRG